MRAAARHSSQQPSASSTRKQGKQHCKTQDQQMSTRTVAVLWEVGGQRRVDRHVDACEVDAAVAVEAAAAEAAANVQHLQCGVSGGCGGLGLQYAVEGGRGRAPAAAARLAISASRQQQRKQAAAAAQAGSSGASRRQQRTFISKPCAAPRSQARRASSMAWLKAGAWVAPEPTWKATPSTATPSARAASSSGSHSCASAPYLFPSWQRAPAAGAGCGGRGLRFHGPNLAK